MGCGASAEAAAAAAKEQQELEAKYAAEREKEKEEEQAKADAKKAKREAERAKKAAARDKKNAETQSQAAKEQADKQQQAQEAQEQAAVRTEEDAENRKAVLSLTVMRQGGFDVSTKDEMAEVVLLGCIAVGPGIPMAVAVALVSEIFPEEGEARVQQILNNHSEEVAQTASGFLDFVDGKKRAKFEQVLVEQAETVYTDAVYEKFKSTRVRLTKREALHAHLARHILAMTDPGGTGEWLARFDSEQVVLWNYALERLPHHTIQGRSQAQAERMLTDLVFLEEAVHGGNVQTLLDAYVLLCSKLWVGTQRNSPIELMHAFLRNLASELEATPKMFFTRLLDTPDNMKISHQAGMILRNKNPKIACSRVGTELVPRRLLLRVGKPQQRSPVALVLSTHSKDLVTATAWSSRGLIAAVSNEQIRIWVGLHEIKFDTSYSQPGREKTMPPKTQFPMRRVVAELKPGAATVSAIEFSPCGSILAAACVTGLVNIYQVAFEGLSDLTTEPAAWEPTAILDTYEFWQAKGAETQKYPVTTVAFNLDGTLLAAGLKFGGVSLWDIHAGKGTFRNMLTQYNGAVSSLAFNDTTALVVGCNPDIEVQGKPEKNKFDGPDTLSIWNWQEGTAVDLFDNRQKVTCCCVCGSSMVVGYSALETSEIGDEVNCRGLMVFVRSYTVDKREVWKRVEDSSGESQRLSHDDTDIVTSVTMVPEDTTQSLCVSVTKCGTSKVWDLKSMRMLLSVPDFLGLGSTLTSVTPSACGELIIIGGGQQGNRDKELVELGGCVKVLSLEALRQYAMMAPAGHKALCKSITIHPSGARFTSAGARGVRVWRRGTWHCWKSLDWRPEDRSDKLSVTTVRYTPDGSLLAAVYKETSTPDTVVVYSTTSDEAVNELKCAADTLGEHVLAMEFSPDGTSLALTFTSGGVVVWELGKRDKSVPGHFEAATCLAFSLPEGHLLATGSTDKTIKIHEIHGTGTIKKHLKGHRDRVSSVAYHPRDKNMLGSGSKDGTCILWDLEVACPKFILEPPETVAVNVIAFHPNEACQIALGLHRAKNGLACIEEWDFSHTEPQKHAEILGHDQPVADLKYSKDGSYIASAAGKFVYATTSSESSHEDKKQERLAMIEIQEREDRMQEAAAAEVAAKEAHEAKKAAAKAAAEAVIAAEAVREAIEEEDHAELLKALESAKSTGQTHWVAAETSLLTTKRDMETKIIMFATASNEYDLLVEDLADATAKMKGLEEEADDLDAQAVVTEKLACDYPSPENSALADDCRKVASAKQDELYAATEATEKLQKKCDESGTDKAARFLEAEEAKESYNEAQIQAKKTQEAMDIIEKKILQATLDHESKKG